MQQVNSAYSATSHQKPPTVTNVEEDVVADCTVYAAMWRKEDGESELDRICPACVSSKQASTAAAGKRNADLDVFTGSIDCEFHLPCFFVRAFKPPNPQHVGDVV